MRRIDEIQQLRRELPGAGRRRACASGRHRRTTRPRRACSATWGPVSAPSATSSTACWWPASTTSTTRSRASGASERGVVAVQMPIGPDGEPLLRREDRLNLSLNVEPRLRYRRTSRYLRRKRDGRHRRPRLPFRRRAQGTGRRARGRRARDLPAATHPAGQARHPARRARHAPAEEAQRRRGGHHAGRRRGTLAHPGGAGAGCRRREPGQPARRGTEGTDVFCPECGFRNSEGAGFCARCGASLVAEQPDAQTTISYQPQEDEGALGPLDRRAREGERSSSAAAGAGPARPTRSTPSASTLGRHPAADIFLDDVTVSRNHAVVQREGEQLRARRRGQPQRHLRQSPRAATAPSSPTATRSRSASTS